MICLGANYLIGGVSQGRPESAQLLTWFQEGERFFTAMPAWYEFLCGPVTEAQIATMRAFLRKGFSASIRRRQSPPRASSMR